MTNVLYRVVKVAPEFKVIAEELNREEAQKVWKEYSFKDIDCAVTMYAIEDY